MSKVLELNLNRLSGYSWGIGVDRMLTYSKRRKLIRAALKRAVVLQQRDQISEELLHFLASSALAWEISEGMNEKTSKKMDRITLKGKQILSSIKD